jgi:putative 4-mercaptohistidine N1-methyltranferase
LPRRQSTRSCGLTAGVGGKIHHCRGLTLLPGAFSIMSNRYETDTLVSQYLLFHYGNGEDQCPYSFGPMDSCFYPIRCVTEFLPDIGPVECALDLGCAVGRSTFELSRWAERVIGIDLSNPFIAAAKEVQETGVARIQRLEEGKINISIERSLPDSIDRTKVTFEVGDAIALRKDIGTFDVVLAANLIDRVNSPRRLLQTFQELVRPGGFLILTSPYTWLEEFTEISEWLGGTYDKAGEPSETLAGIERTLGPSFSLEKTKNLPFLIREHVRKYQWSVAQATVWRAV